MPQNVTIRGKRPRAASVGAYVCMTEMTSERAQAYGRVTAMLADGGPTKLQDDEQDIVREAADTLLFCEDVHAYPAGEAAPDAIDELVERLCTLELRAT